MVFGYPEKVVDSILSNIKLLTPVKEDDQAGLIAMITIVERCWLDLRRLKLEREMNTSTMTTIIKKLLPMTQKWEWILYKQHNLEPTATEKFESLLAYLLQEKNAIEYMNADIRLKVKRGNVSFTDGISSSSNKSSTNHMLASLQNAVEELTNAITSSKISVSKKLYSRQAKCWLHDTDANKISE